MVDCWYAYITHTHTHTKQSKQVKQSLRQRYETQLLPPSKPALGFLYTTQALEANPPRAGLVIRRRTHGGRSRNPKFHNNLNTTKRDKDSWAFASLVNTRYPLMLQLGGLLPQMT